jgi:hypothetical protein
LSPELLERFEKFVSLDISEELKEIDWNAVLRDLLGKPVRTVNSKPKVKARFFNGRRSLKTR